MTSDDLAEYFNGNKLFGDDLSPDEIRAWYDDEKEAYADLGAVVIARPEVGVRLLFIVVPGTDLIRREIITEQLVAIEIFSQIIACHFKSMPWRIVTAYFDWWETRKP